MQARVVSSASLGACAQASPATRQATTGVSERRRSSNSYYSLRDWTQGGHTPGGSSSPPARTLPQHKSSMPARAITQRNRKRVLGIAGASQSWQVGDGDPSRPPAAPPGTVPLLAAHVHLRMPASCGCQCHVGPVEKTDASKLATIVCIFPRGEALWRTARRNWHSFAGACLILCLRKFVRGLW